MASVNVSLDLPFPLLSRATGTFNSQGTAMPESFTNCLIMAEVTVPGTSLDLKYQVSPNGGITWFDHPSGAMPQITAVGNKAFAVVDSIGSFYRIQAVVAGGPNTARVWAEFKR